nr:hypothetical protein BaRGS_014302 [Batillaria attramentaria]
MDFTMELLRKYGNTTFIPDQKTLKTYNLTQLSALWHSYLDHVHITCQRHIRMGNLGDGGYEVCDDIQWRPIRPCLVYSFGIRNDFSFDDDVANVYGCDVFSFDPSMKKKTHRHSERVMFYKMGLGGKTEQRDQWEIHTLSDLKKMLNHTGRVVDVLKMDIEENEWEVLSNIIEERQLINVRQLFIEYHFLFFSKEETVEAFLSKFAVLRALQDIGFRIFYTHKYSFGNCNRRSAAFPVVRTSCYEVQYVNVNFGRDMEI